MNVVELTGKVLNCYISETGALITKVAVRHNHIVGKQNVCCESVFNVIMVSDEAIKKTDVKQGDTVRIVGYVKMDFKETLGGNQHQKLSVYASEIESVSLDS